MAIVEHQLIINAPIEKIFDISQDYAVRYQWDPFPERIELLHGATTVERGVKALVVAKSGLRMEVEFIQVTPPVSAAVMMIKGPAFLEKFAGSWIFRASGPHHTHAKFRYVIKAKRWAIPFIAEKVAALYFARAVQARMQGLKSYCEESLKNQR